jgi:hypothetical protein
MSASVDNDNENSVWTGEFAEKDDYSQVNGGFSNNEGAADKPTNVSAADEFRGKHEQTTNDAGTEQTTEETRTVPFSELVRKLSCFYQSSFILMLLNFTGMGPQMNASVMPQQNICYILRRRTSFQWIYCRDLP